MAGLSYPDTLPNPTQARHVPKQRTRTSDSLGLPLYQNYQSDYTGTMEVAFFLTSAQLPVFYAWWKDDLLGGGRWFNCNWPALRPGALILQFTTEPTWSHVYNGAFRVTAIVQVRGESRAVQPLPLPRLYYTAVITDGPTGYWRLGESSGITAFNEITTNPNLAYSAPGAMQGAASLLTGDANTAATFSGAQYLIQLGSGLYTYNRNFSVELIFKTTSGGALIGKGRTGWYLRVAANKIQFLQSQTTVIGTGSKTVNTGVKFHLVLTVATSGLWTVYLNGVLDMTGTTGVTFGNIFELMVGVDAFNAPNTEFFNGVIDEVAMYNYALSAAQAASHAALI